MCAQQYVWWHVLVLPKAWAEVLLYFASSPAREGSEEARNVNAENDVTKNECEAIHANWNLAIQDRGIGPFKGDIQFQIENPNGCHPFMREHVGDKLVLIDTAGTCDNLVLTTHRAAAAGANGVIFYHSTDGLVGISLGDYDAPAIRAIMIERAHGEAIRDGLTKRALSAHLVQGRLISEDAYEEQFIFRADEIAATRAVNFLWHTHPIMLMSSGYTPLSMRLMQNQVKIPNDWFSTPPFFVPLFNPSLISLDDGSFLATFRMSNGPGCPSVRRSKESSMDTRIFRNALMLAHLDPRTLEVKSHVLVDTPPLICQFRENTKVSGRKFLEEVQGPMDARIVNGIDGEFWVSFYAERNVPDSDDIVRGIHASPLHVEWRSCNSTPSQKWQLQSAAGAYLNSDCKWIGLGDGRNSAACRMSCDEETDCNVVNFQTRTCVLRSCKSEAKPASLEGWEAWRRIDSGSWRKTSHGCAWLGVGSASDVMECQRVCENTSSCDAITFSASHVSCFLQRCGRSVATKPLPSGWEGWRLHMKEEGSCLDRAWINPEELIAFPANDGVEKNWNLIKVEKDRIFIEYHVEPHIVLQANIDRSHGVGLRGLGQFSVSRWPFDVLHGVSNVRGGFCCMTLAHDLWRGRLHTNEDVADDSSDSRGGLPLDGPLLLGCGHLQRIRTPFDQAQGDLNRFRRQAKSRTYHQFFYALRPTEPFDVVAVSPEWCIAVNGHFSGPWRSQLVEGEDMCEAIQFASGLALRGSDELVVSYGINDCEGDLLVLQLARVLEMLRPVRSNLSASLEDIEMI